MESALLERLGRGPVTPLSALRELGIFDLDARIAALRAAGHVIIRDRVEAIYLDEPCHLAAFRLVPK
ncbi:MAG: hypothetical protein JNM98_21690 [Rhodocyclaceae bacterium]|nr:hypothetical protein [Rhodocyclaceae bacterium]